MGEDEADAEGTNLFAMSLFFRTRHMRVWDVVLCCVAYMYMYEYGYEYGDWMDISKYGYMGIYARQGKARRGEAR